jgi:hypothetical protein
MSGHPWAGWIDSPETVSLVWAAKKRLDSAWKRDRKDPARYPVNTSYALAVIEEALAKKTPDVTTKTDLPKWRKPRSLAELVPERFVKAIWEGYNSGTFKDAVARAAEFDNVGKSWKTFRTIIRAIEAAYLAGFIGPEVLPRTKVNILHTGLDKIAKAAGLEDQTEKGFAGFLNDICPCGIRNHREAVRKLSSRSARVRRAKR